ncbi:MAG: ATPase [Oscillatoriales cyanobacterium]|nr:MAG: ATPase [Oscillatoriales cyanobacterium]
MRNQTDQSDQSDQSDQRADRLRCVLGIDGGGTKTACVVLDAKGRTIAQGESHASNYHAVGAEVAQSNIRQAIEQAIAQVLTHPNPQLNSTHHPPLDLRDLEIGGIGLGLAGVASREDVAVVRGWVAEYIAAAVGGCRWAFQAVDHDRVYIDHDCAIALTGGVAPDHAPIHTQAQAVTRIGVGIAAIAGTGSIVFGRDATGATARVGGWGYLLGDEGSGYDIARRGLQAALWAADGRGDQTALLREFQQHFQARSPRDLVMAIYRHHLPVRDLAALSVIVDRAAVAGDRVAHSIIDQGATDLAIAIRACARQLFAPDDPFEIVTIGGVWQSGAGFRDRVVATVRSEFPQAGVIWPRRPPAHGAALTVLQAISP